MERSLLLFLIDRLGGVRSDKHGGVRCPSTEVSEHERIEVLVGPQDDTWFVWEARGTVDAPQCRTRSEVRGPSRRRTGIPDGWSEVQVGGDCWGPQIGAQKLVK